MVSGTHGLEHEDKIRELAMSVMAQMRDNEEKLIRDAKKFIKQNRYAAKKVFTADIDGWTPIHACAMRGSKKLLKTMLNAGIDVNIQMGQPEGLPRACTLLHVAANRSDSKICEYLITSGADINMTDSFDRTPLYYMAKNDKKRLIKLVKDRGSDTSIIEKWLPEWNIDVSEDCVKRQRAMKLCFFFRF